MDEMQVKILFAVICGAWAAYCFAALAVPGWRFLTRYRSGVPWSSLAIAANGMFMTFLALATLGVATLATGLLALAIGIAWVGYFPDADRKRFQRPAGHK